METPILLITCTSAPELKAAFTTIPAAWANAGGECRWRTIAQGFGEQGQAHEIIIVAIGRINIHIEHIGCGQAIASLAELLPALIVDLRRCTRSYGQRQASAVNQAEQLEGQVGFAWPGEVECSHAFAAQTTGQQGGQTFTQAGGIDNQGAHVPVLNQGYRGCELLQMRLAGPALLMYDLDTGQVEFIEVHPSDAEDAAIVTLAFALGMP